VEWNTADPTTLHESVDALVLRSPWDYPEHHALFLQWLDALRVTVRNTKNVVTWNSNKRYLLDIASAGVPTVDTTVVDPRASWMPPTRFGELVVKPEIGAGSIGIGRYREDELMLARKRVEEIHQTGRAALIQPYLPSVDDGSETALVFVNGVFTHAVSKGPMLRRDEPVELVSGLYVAEEIGSRVATPKQLLIARQALDTIPEFTQGEMPLYARVDLIDDIDGNPIVLELELIEPSLFFAFHPPAADRFVAVIQAML